MKRLIILIIIIFMFCGCGEPGGGAEFFSTVAVTANCPVSSLDADVIEWKADKETFVNFAGIGNGETGHFFTNGGRIEFEMEYDDSFIFTVELINFDTGEIADIFINSKFESTYPDPGIYYLDITATGNWSIDIDITLGIAEICDDYEVYPDYVKINISSEKFEIIEPEEASSIRIESVRIDYYPANESTPPLPSIVQALGQIVGVDETVSINIMILNQDQKRSLLDALVFAPLCSSIDFPIYKYFISLNFHAIETMTKTDGDFSTNLNIQIADFIGNDDDCDPDLAFFCAP